MKDKDDVLICEPGDSFELDMEIIISIHDHREINRTELKLAIDYFIRRWIEENY